MEITPTDIHSSGQIRSSSEQYMLYQLAGHGTTTTATTAIEPSASSVSHIVQPPPSTELQVRELKLKSGLP